MFFTCLSVEGKVVKKGLGKSLVQICKGLEVNICFSGSKRLSSNLLYFRSDDADFMVEVCSLYLNFEQNLLQIAGFWSGEFN